MLALQICRIISILIHFFFTATFVFMLLEAIHTYSIVAFVVRKNGILSRAQNVLVGWLVSAGTLVSDIGKDFECSPHSALSSHTIDWSNK